jgi:DNA invertase Pin-like site-specific DNA recombinase
LAVEMITDLHGRGVQIKSLTEPDIDTTTPGGRALFGIVAVFARLRVDTIGEGTRAGLARARSAGRVGGRPTVMSAERTALAARLRGEKQSLDAIAATLGVGRSSVSRALAAAAAAGRKDGAGGG